MCMRDAPAPTEKVPFYLQAREFLTRRPPKALVVSACRQADYACADPETRVADALGTGDITLQLPWEFSGYLELTSSETLTSLYYLSRPLTEPTVATSTLMLTPELATMSTMLTDWRYDEQNGLVVVQMYDCAGKAAGGVRFEVNRPSPGAFFLVNGLPSTEVKTTVFDAMNNMAAGGFSNVTPGTLLVAVRLGESGPLLAQFNIYVRPRSVSQLEIHP